LLPLFFFFFSFCYFSFESVEWTRRDVDRRELYSGERLERDEATVRRELGWVRKVNKRRLLLHLRKRHTYSGEGEQVRVFVLPTTPVNLDVVEE
jgi:hypothetical protein